MGASQALIRDLYDKIDDIAPDRRALALRHLTDLFLVGAEQYSADDIALIDDIFVRLMESIDDAARALLASRLGPVAKAPPKLLHRLACDDLIDVASAVLTQSEAAGRRDTDRMRGDQDPGPHARHLAAQDAVRDGDRRAGQARRPRRGAEHGDERRRALFQEQLRHPGQPRQGRRRAGGMRRRAAGSAAGAVRETAGGRLRRGARRAGSRAPSSRPPTSTAPSAR